MTHTIWSAKTRDLDVVMDLLNQRVQWLRDRGLDQWSTSARWEPEMVASISHHRTMLLRDSNMEAVGTVTLSTDGDPDFWTEAERTTPALYPSKLATRLDVAGQGLGELMLDYVMYEARARQLAEVRLDVWKTSHGLHQYYERRGWTYLRTVNRPGRYSGALFTRAVDGTVVNWPPDEVEIRPPGGGTGTTAMDEDPYRAGVASFVCPPS